MQQKIANYFLAIYFENIFSRVNLKFHGKPQVSSSKNGWIMELCTNVDIEEGGLRGEGCLQVIIQTNLFFVLTGLVGQNVCIV